MRILRGVSSRLLSCGCLTGVYETYDGEIVVIVDARGASCVDTAHADGSLVPNAPPLGAGSGPRRPASRSSQTD
jgi:hypothetical protein